VHLVGFIIRIYHNAQSPEHQIITHNLLSDMHMEYTGFRQLLSCHIKVKLYETSTNKASYIQWGPSNKSDLFETQCMHFNLSMSGKKTLALCDYSVTMHETNCWKILSLVCMFMALWCVRRTVLLIGINISDNSAASIFRMKPQVRHSRVHPNTIQTPMYQNTSSCSNKTVIILIHTDVYYNADKKYSICRMTQWKVIPYCTRFM